MVVLEHEIPGQKLLSFILNSPLKCLARQLQSFTEEETSVVTQDPEFGGKLLFQVLRRCQETWRTKEESMKVCKLVADFVGQSRLDDRLSPTGVTVMHLAAREGAIDILQVLVQQRASVEGTDLLKRTPLHQAALSGQLASLQFLLEARASATACDKFLRRPLFYARGAKAECTRALLKLESIEADAPDRDGQTALFEAAVRGCPEKAKALLAANAEVDAVDKVGQTPLFAAAALGREKVCLTLLKAGANVDKLDSIRRSPLSIAEAEPNTKVIRVLRSYTQRQAEEVHERTQTLEETQQEIPDELQKNSEGALKAGATGPAPSSPSSSTAPAPSKRRKRHRFVLKDKRGAKHRKFNKITKGLLAKFCAKAGWDPSIWNDAAK